MIRSFGDKAWDWRVEFRKKVKLHGFENAYRILRGFQKFNNYSNNKTPCDYSGVIKYTEERAEDTSDEYFDSARVANIILRRISKTS